MIEACGRWPSRIRISGLGRGGICCARRCSSNGWRRHWRDRRAAGNHDHHLVHRDVENRLEARLAGGEVPPADGSGPPRRRASAASSPPPTPPGRVPPILRPASSPPATLPRARSRPLPGSSPTSAGAARATASSSPTPTSPSPTSARAATPAPATGTPAPGSTSPTSARARPTPATLRHAWPGTAVAIDDEEPEPRLLELLADLNPLNGGPGLPSPDPPT